jgi:hypothetical protein
MKSCEEHELAISILIDGEMPPEDLLPAIDHLAGCASCRSFYKDARSLAAAVPSALSADRSEAAAPAPEAVWQRIEEAGLGASSRAGSWRTWAPRLAAALLLIAGSAWAVFSIGRTLPADPGQPIEVVLGEDGGLMTERRFVEITAEILRADSRYHQEMLEVMATVAEQTRRQETPADVDSPLSEEQTSDSDFTEAFRGERKAT